MTYKFKNFIHCVQIDGELTLLDEISDRYIFLSVEETDQLKVCMVDDSRTNGVVESLLIAGVLEEGKDVLPFPINQARPKGIDAYAWAHRSEFVDEIVAKFNEMVKATFILWLVIFLLRSKGLRVTLNFIRRMKYNLKIKTSNRFSVSYAAAIFHKVAFLGVGRVRCLEMALSLFIWCVNRGINVDLVIGIQKYDFLSHAWIEYDGKVVADSPAVQEGLCEILRI